MLIKNYIRAALTIFVLVGVGAAGCSNDDPEKDPVVSSTAPSATTPKTKSKSAPDLAFEGVGAGGIVAATGNTFTLTGLVRNTGNATGKLGVTCRASDNGIAIMYDTSVATEVESLVPGLASTFTCKTDPIKTGSRTSVQWTYWGTINGTSLAEQYTAAFSFPASTPVPPPAPTVYIKFSTVTATLDGTDFHLKGTVTNTGTLAADVSGLFEASDTGVLFATGSLDLVLSTLAPGASTTFDKAVTAVGHAQVTWKYRANVNPADGASYSTPEATISFP